MDSQTNEQKKGRHPKLKSLILTTALAMVVLLVACGGGGSDNANAPEASPEPE